jgi:hypothetical protein
MVTLPNVPVFRTQIAVQEAVGVKEREAKEPVLRHSFTGLVRQL